MNTTKTMHWFFSISTAVVLYVLLFVLFVPMELDVRQRKDNDNKIFMLPLSGDLSPGEKDLVTWMKNEDPTLIVQPNRKYNYSRVLLEKSHFHLNDGVDDFNFLKTDSEDLFKNMKISPITISGADIEKKVEKYELYSYPTLPQLPFKIPVVNITYPCFRDYYSGEIIPIMIPVTIEIKKFLKNHKPLSYTFLNVESASNSDLFPFVKIVKSCGNAKLDMLAVNNVVTQAGMNTEYFGYGRDLKIVVEWSK